MKRTFYLACPALLAAASALSASCKSANGVEKETAAVESAARVEAKADTLVTAPAYTYTTKQDSTIECSFEVDYPKGTDSLAAGVKQFIADELSAIYFPYNYEDDAAALTGYPKYSGNVAQCDAIVKHYADGTKRYFIQLQKETMQERTENDWIPRYLCDVKVKKRTETPKYVTYSVANELYSGGAHGSHLYSETTISKRTCHPLVQTVDTTKVMAMQPLLRKGIVGYLKDCGVENAETEYKSHLFLPEDGHFPLPATTPSLTPDGVSFVYQQYEIASYAVGLVSFTIPYAEIMPYLCDEAKQLVTAE